MVTLGFAAPEEMFDAFTLPLGLAEEDRSALRPVFDRLLAERPSSASKPDVEARCAMYAGRRPE